MTEKQLAAIVRGIMPVVREQVTQAVAGRVVTLETDLARATTAASQSLADLALLRDRVLIAETKAAVPSAGELSLVDLRERLASLEQRVTTDAAECLTLRDRITVAEVRALVPGPTGKDGTNGLDGKDGLGFDDLSVEFDGERTLAFQFTRGELKKSFPITVPFLRYRGIYQRGLAYTVGDTVTFANQVWYCRETTVTAPGDGSKVWQLCVRSGRDGKDGMPGDRGPEGKAGKDWRGQ